MRERRRRALPVASLGDVADELVDRPAASSFLRGLTVGALVGAAIAGSLIVGRRRGHDDQSSADAAPPPTGRGEGTGAS